MDLETWLALGACAQVNLLVFRWALALLGIGLATLAGCAGLANIILTGAGRGRPAALAALVPGRRWPAPAEAAATVLKLATRGAVLALGGALALGAWWAWQAVGGLTGGDPRESWLAVSSLLAAASLLGWRIERRAALWAAILAVLAAASALLGLLAVPALQHLLWT